MKTPRSHWLGGGWLKKSHGMIHYLLYMQLLSITLFVTTEWLPVRNNSCFSFSQCNLVLSLIRISLIYNLLLSDNECEKAWGEVVYSNLNKGARLTRGKFLLRITENRNSASEKWFWRASGENIDTATNFYIRFAELRRRFIWNLKKTPGLTDLFLRWYAVIPCAPI